MAVSKRKSDRSSAKTAASTDVERLSAMVAEGEGPSLEFKRSTGELKEAMQTLCAFLNGGGGTVLFGVGPKGTIEGQQVSDRTLRDVAQAGQRFEPPADLTVQRLPVAPGREVLVVTVTTRPDAGPFVYDGRPYERVASTTRRMAQTKYDKRLLDRAHRTWRWEDEPVERLTLKDLDRKEILRTRELAIQHNRISVDTGRDIGEILDRLGLRVGGILKRAALMLYGKQLLPHYPQCLLKMGRFRGTEITGEIVDNRQEYINAFAMVREGMAFLERTMPLGARFPTGQIFREDRFPVPLDALREILLNAVMHRDYSDHSGYVAIVVFDDRIEIRSYGRLPSGITVKKLSGKHDSKPVNPLIAGAFHRTGAVEVWGRGTNRVIEMCRQHGAALPVFEETQGFVHVTFKAPMVVGGAAATPGDEVTAELTGQVAGQVTGQVAAQVLRFCQTPRKASEIRALLNLRHRETFVDNYLRPLLETGWLEPTIPEKPKSRLQRYRTTAAGLAMVENARTQEDRP